MKVLSRITRFIVVGAMALLTTVPASAAVIDFESLSTGTAANPLALPGATFTTAGGVNVIGNFNDNWLCSSPNAGSVVNCSRPLEVAFDAPTNDPSFVFLFNNTLTIGADIGDVQVFSGMALLGTVDILVADGSSFTNDLVSLAGFMNVTRLVISSTDLGGIGYDDFSFQSAVAPEPSLLALLGFGVLAGAARRRGNAAVR